MDVRLLVAAMAVVSSVVGVAVSADAVAPRSTVVLDTLDSPAGLAIDRSGGGLLIGQDNWPVFLPDASIVKVPLLGPQRLQPIPVTDRPVPVDFAVNPTNGRLWVIDFHTQHVMRQRVDGSFVTVIDMPAYQDGDPDPVALPGPIPLVAFPEPPSTDPTASWPAGLAFRSNGELLVADQFNNDVVLVLPNGTARTVARFDVELLPVSESVQFFSGYSLGAEMQTAAAPVTVMIGNDGFVYVGEQKGFPYPAAASHVWRIDPAVLAPGATPAWCSVSEPDPRCKVYASGFTGIVDIAAARPSQSGHIYVLEHSVCLCGQLVFGQGGFGPQPGRLTRANGRSKVPVETVALNGPADLVVMGGGAIYITDWGETSGRLSKTWN